MEDGKGKGEEGVGLAETRILGSGHGRIGPTREEKTRSMEGGAEGTGVHPKGKTSRPYLRPQEGRLFGTQGGENGLVGVGVPTVSDRDFED